MNTIKFVLKITTTIILCGQFFMSTITFSTLRQRFLIQICVFNLLLKNNFVVILQNNHMRSQPTVWDMLFPGNYSHLPRGGAIPSQRNCFRSPSFLLSRSVELHIQIANSSFMIPRSLRAVEMLLPTESHRSKSQLGKDPASRDFQFCVTPSTLYNM